MNAKETMQLLAALKTLDPKGWVTIDNTTISVWTAVLNQPPGIPAAAAMHAAAHYAARPEADFPKPGQFRGIVAEIVCGLPSVDEAGRQIVKSMKLNYPGMPAKYTPDRIVLDAVRQIGGIHVFRVSQSERETADLWRQFRTKYTAIRAEQLEDLDITAAWHAALASGNGRGDQRQVTAVVTVREATP